MGETSFGRMSMGKRVSEKCLSRIFLIRKMKVDGMCLGTRTNWVDNWRGLDEKYSIWWRGLENFVHNFCTSIYSMAK